VLHVYSDGLRAALGVKPNQLPPYVYQMRVFGYPPGHLENARQEMSGLAMFGKHGLGELLSGIVCDCCCILSTKKQWRK